MQPKTNGLALAGFICAVLLFPAFIGLILSIIGLVQINNSQGMQKGKGLALAGIIISAVVLVFGTFIRIAAMGSR
jgi:hypothetical protein